MVFGILKKLKKGKKGKKKKVTKKKAVKKSKKIKKKATRAKKKKKTVRKTPVVVEELVRIGEITHYFPHVKAAVIKLSVDTLEVGETLHIKGHTTDFKQKISSMQIDHVPITKAKKGDDIGLLVKKRVRSGDKVYKI